MSFTVNIKNKGKKENVITFDEMIKMREYIRLIVAPSLQIGW